MYCLDTNIVINIFRNDEKTILKMNKIEDSVAITAPVLCELYKGCHFSNNKVRDLKSIDEFSTETILLDFDITSCKIFGELTAILSKRGKETQIIDLMIAAICIAHNATLVTSNKKHFEHIPGLKAEYV